MKHWLHQRLRFALEGNDHLVHKFFNGKRIAYPDYTVTILIMSTTKNPTEIIGGVVLWVGKNNENPTGRIVL
jgi:hypothetical protein